MDLKKKINILDVIFVVAGIGSMIFWYANGINGNDFWWHVKVGEYICQNGIIPTSDIFSWMRNTVDIPWTAHEWLSEVILYLLYHCAGELGIFLIFFMLACVCYVLVYGQIRKFIGKNYAISGIYLYLFTVIIPMFFFGRPQVFGFFLLFFELKILYSFYEKDGGKIILLIPPLAMAWSNLYGGSSNLTYLLCLMFLISGCITISFGRVEGRKLSKKARGQLALVTPCTMAAILVNPIGLKVLTYPYVNLSDKLSMTLIKEWQSPDAKNLGQLILLFLPILLMSMGIIVEEKKIRLIDLIVMLFFVFLFMRSVRFIILWFIAASFYAFPYLPSFEGKFEKQKLRTIVGGVMLILGLLQGISGAVISAGTIRDGKIIKTVLDERMIQKIKEVSPKRPFNDYDYGEALIFHDVPVFFDSRADLFSAAGILADGFSLTKLQNVNPDEILDIEGLMEKYQFDYFIVNDATPIYIYLKSHFEKYELLSEIDGAALFQVISE